MNNEQNIKWGKDGLPELDFTDENKQQCLRCGKKPASKDGSDDGEFYCKECIEIRNRIDKIKPKEEERIVPKKMVTDVLQLWEEKPDEEELKEE
jgi:late competence protein required for DNA uptake (superfamily II DNA/RNA helicase)